MIKICNLLCHGNTELDILYHRISNKGHNGNNLFTVQMCMNSSVGLFAIISFYRLYFVLYCMKCQLVINRPVPTGFKVFKNAESDNLYDDFYHIN